MRKGEPCVQAINFHYGIIILSIRRYLFIVYIVGVKLLPVLNSVQEVVLTNSLTEIGIKNPYNDMCMKLVSYTYYLSVV